MKRKTRVLKLADHDPRAELEFEVEYLRSLTTQQRVRLMQQRTQELLRLLDAHGHRRTPQVVKRLREDFEHLLKLKKRG